jgi:hypothetical protein
MQREPLGIAILGISEAEFRVLEKHFIVLGPFFDLIKHGEWGIDGDVQLAWREPGLSSRRTFRYLVGLEPASDV